MSSDNHTTFNTALLDIPWTTTPFYIINSTTPDLDSRYISRGGQILITSVYLFGAVANICSLVLLSQGPQARNKKLTLMIRCLSANDLLALCSSFLLVYMRIYLDPSFVASRWYCGLRVLTRFFGFSSGSVASVMAVERFIALTSPFFYQKHVTHKLVRRAIFVQWCFVMAVVLLPLAGFGLYYTVDHEGVCVCARYRQATETTDVVYAYLMFGFGTAMCTVIVCCNLAVVVALCRLKPTAATGRTTVTRDNRKQLHFNHATQEELSFAKLMVVLCVFFVACWLPQMVTILIAQANPDLKHHPFFHLADVCTALNFILDPVVYVLSRRPHRKGLRNLLKPLCQRCWLADDNMSSCTGSRDRPMTIVGGSVQQRLLVRAASSPSQEFTR
ncbi:hypothetical protein JTE90_009598 [Oedothorax gibbosus]|uniref:G-protein coupled receptors family 1 profile domain-containing protein n=1 Tax=Oedothorax gibbosus TaxID=931172 RepID=A0AAV6VL10_9ARAC|nr:hypothetical protein JTE90_009598 [Oedothorax gibbosus]